MYDAEEMMLAEYPDILTPAECREALGIGRSIFYKLVGSGELPVKRVGNKIWRIAKSDLIKYITEN